MYYIKNMRIKVKRDERRDEEWIGPRRRREEVIKPRDYTQEPNLTLLKDLLQEIKRATEALNEVKQVLKNRP